MDLPDVLHALCQSLRNSALAGGAEVLGTAATAYALVERLSWPDDHFDEKSDLLGSLALVSWNECRKSNRHTEMALFGERCEQHVVERETLRDFLALPFEQRSTSLNDRFLSDACVLLASLLRLARLRDVMPRSIAREAQQLYAWITENALARPEEETAWFAAHAALYTSGSLRFLGQLRAADQWLDVARSWLRDGPTRAALEGQIEYARLSILYCSGRYESLLQAIPRLWASFDRQGMEADAAKASFLEASALKAVGNGSALGRFLQLAKSPAVRRNSSLLGLCLVNAADLSAQEGRCESAMALLAEARPLIEEAGISWGIAHLESVVGELLRDQGHLAGAIAAYGCSIATYLEGGFSSQGAYVRVILAQTLIAAGRDAEAIVELLAALPVIERESLAREGVAAAALLRASLQRYQADPQALRALREQLDRMKKGGEL